MYGNVELRKLPAGTLCKIINILDFNEDWKKFMSIIPKNLLDANCGLKYSKEHITLIEEHAKATNQKCAEILMDEWSTSGRVRPTLKHLKSILIKADQWRAADEIATMLQESLPERPSHGPAALVTTEITKLLNQDSTHQVINKISTNNMNHSNKNSDVTTRQMQPDSNIIKFSISDAGEKYPDGKETESNLINFSKDNDEQNSMNIPALSVLMAPIDIYEKSTTPITNYNPDTESSNQSCSERDPPIDKEYNIHNYQQSFPDIPISAMEIDTIILKDKKLADFDYYELEVITGNFSDNLEMGPNGLKGKIGSGGFGDVFVGKHSLYGTVAVKKAHSHITIERKPDLVMNIFNAEVKYLSRYRHKNIVSIIGYSKNGPTPCIVSEYIDGGNLQDKIQSKELKNETLRIFIMAEIAEGLKYLHTNDQIVGSSDPSVTKFKKFVHGDIKTTNILLTKDYIPKLCDFGVAKQYDSTFLTTCFMGTSAYMAPEALQGTVTQKTDIFSYGIVLLELLTGLKPIINHNGFNFNIKHYVEDHCTDNDITPLLDPTANPWTKAAKIYALASNCFEHNWNRRPSINDVCKVFANLKSDN